MKKETRRVVGTLVLVFGVLYLLVCSAFFFSQAKLVWIPGEAPRSTPAEFGLPYEEVALVAADGERLHGWWIPAAEPRGALVFCHGNAGSIEGRIPAAAALRELGLSVLLFDWRGYGRSEGRTSEAGTYLDAEAAWQHVVTQRKFAPERVVAFGESLGGAVAIELALRQPVGALVTEATFTSLPAVGARLYRWLPVRLLARIRYDSLSKAPRIKVPWLLLHSPDDELIPFAHARELAAAAGAPTQLVPTGGGHNDGGFLDVPAARQALLAFLDQKLPALRPTDR